MVFAENFEEGSVPAVIARYDDFKNPPGMALVADVPAQSCGSASMRLTAGGPVSATDLYKQLPDHDEWYVRWYVKYQAGVPWHHCGMWFGGYNPAMPYPSPMAGNRRTATTGSRSRSSRYGVSASPPALRLLQLLDGDALVDADPMRTTAPRTTATRSSTGTPSRSTTTSGYASRSTSGSTRTPSRRGRRARGVEERRLVQRFDDGGRRLLDPRQVLPERRRRHASAPTIRAPCHAEVLDLQHRITTALQLNTFWPQNYITDPAMGTLRLDHMVLAKVRIGCIR